MTVLMKAGSEQRHAATTCVKENKSLFFHEAGEFDQINDY